MAMPQTCPFARYAFLFAPDLASSNCTISADFPRSIAPAITEPIVSTARRIGSASRWA
jgi:hypothetical protein